jgi:hypothetical protein
MDAICPAVLSHLQSSALVRLLPDWCCDAGLILLYFVSQKLLAAKTRAFLYFVIQTFREQGLAHKLSVQSLDGVKVA